MLGIECVGLMPGGGGVDDVVPPHVAPFRPRDVLSGTPEHEDVLEVGKILGSGVGRRLDLGGGAPAELAVARHEQLCAGVREPEPHRLGGEPAEHQCCLLYTSDAADE